MADLIGVAGARLHYEVVGDGPPVVLVHAGIADSRMWDRLMEPIARRHLVVRYDMRGFGESELAPGAFTHAADLQGLLDALALERPALVGASLGGRVALELAAAHPERVASLVLIAAGMTGHHWSPDLQRIWADEDEALAVGDLDRAVEINLQTWVYGPLRGRDDVEPEVASRVAAMQRRAFELQLAAYTDPADAPDERPAVPDLAERLADIRVPTLVLVGELDQPDFLALADRLAGTIPDASKVVVPNAAHMVAMERPQDVARSIVDFLDAHSARDAQ